MLIIDCYNLLHTTMPPALAGLDELSLCRLLHRGGQSHGRVVIVCDGKPKPHALPDAAPDGIELRYSGPKRSADAVIIELIDANTAPRRLTVVTSDREIQKAARRRRARVIGSDAYVNVLRKLAAMPLATADDDACKPSILDEAQVQRWLETFGVDGDQTLGTDDELGRQDLG
ncbi:MAG: NYN domain-containing protein [Phycisphaeraceae bacterium]|jgi:predicted RNA-binding protein with PIN domain|nr:NYN domain-containing protein [Phycisphaeraceae bacterium]